MFLAECLFSLFFQETRTEKGYLRTMTALVVLGDALKAIPQLRDAWVEK